MAIGMQKQPKTESSEREVDDLSKVPEKRKKPAIVAAVAAACLLILATVFILMSKDAGDSEANGEFVVSDTEAQPEVFVQNGVYGENGMTIDPNGINPGVNNTQESNTTSAKVYSPDDFIKDLNGLDISAVYEVSSIDYVYDYVSYEKRRAIIDDGMELYWLEAEYQGKKYRIETAFAYYKTLRNKGICRVVMEVLTLNNGGKVISYMRYAEESE